MTVYGVVGNGPNGVKERDKGWLVVDCLVDFDVVMISYI